MGTFGRNSLQGHLMTSSLGGPGGTIAPFNGLAPYVEPATSYRVRTVIAQALGKDVGSVGLHTDFESLGGDSILRISIVASLEAQFRKRITDAAARRFRTALELALALKK